MENEVISVNSQWWSAHISQKNTEWLEENVKEADQHVKEMLQLVEQKGDVSAEDVNSNYLNKPALVAHAKEISLRHQLLADHYKNLTKELRNFEETFSMSQKIPPLLTPNSKQGVHTVQAQVVNSHSSPSSNGGISDASSNAYSGSSSFSSDSDSESFNSSPVDRPDQVKHKRHGAIRMEESEDHGVLMQRITDYEKELKISNEKLQFAEQETAKLKIKLQNNKTAFSKMSSLEAQFATAENKIHLYEAHIDTENKKSLLLQREVVELEEKLESEKIQVVELQESVEKYRTELAVRDLEVKKSSGELQDAIGNFALEKLELASCISKLTERLTFHVAKNEELQIEFESLVDELKKCEDGKVEMKRMKEFLEKDVENVKAEVSKKNELINTLNQNLDALKLKHDMLTAEKDEVSAKLQAITAELSSRDNRIRLLVKNTFELQSEKMKLSTIFENAENEKAQLKLRVEELEKKLGTQSVVISERAEEKREAIRQLCYSIDHFRSAYEELHTTYVLKKRPLPCNEL